MNRFVLISVFVSVLTSCSNTPEQETGEIKTLTIFNQALQQSNQPKQFIDARLLLDRKQIDESGVPLLFIELPSGQNGTLTPYPGTSVGQTWLSADGATITLEKVCKSQGCAVPLNDLSLMPDWLINKNSIV